MFKRFALIISLVAALGIGGSTLMASDAAAGTNCQMIESNIYWVGYLHFDASAQHCSLETYKVQFSAGGGGGASGIYDSTIASYVYAFQDCCNQVVYVNGNGTAGQNGYDVRSYCFGQVHLVESYYNFRLLSDTPGAPWGPWHTRFSPWHFINC